VIDGFDQRRGNPTIQEGQQEACVLWENWKNAHNALIKDRVGEPAGFQSA
jgi:hypothetical protein